MQNKIRNHKFVEELYKDSDGWWVILKDGYNYQGQCSLRENTLIRLCQCLKFVKQGNPW